MNINVNRGYVFLNDRLIRSCISSSRAKEAAKEIELLLEMKAKLLQYGLSDDAFQLLLEGSYKSLLK